ncbi:MAG: UDP-glucose 4-epimerase GalE [Fluviibacter phosphoraccumulans]
MASSFENQRILVTGGAGYIGSHTVVQLLEAGAQVIVLDNLCNSKREFINRIEKITGRRPEFVVGDIRDCALLRSVFNKHQIGSVIHFAGLKAVSESEAEPLKYYVNNVSGSVTLFEEMARTGVKRLVFSSSATVYGDPGFVQYTEVLPLKPVNVYGRTKLMVEDVLRDLKKSDDAWRIALLRYFNPVGAHESGLIGEDPNGVPNNLMPFVSQVAVGKRKLLSIFGSDYPTPDGTGVRDYIHVDDLAAGHLAALKYLQKGSETVTVNLGTGRPYSVLEMVKAFEEAAGKPIPYEIQSRRAGDLAEYYAEPSLAKETLGWEAKLGIDRMCEDTWRWQTMNPRGFR